MLVDPGLRATLTSINIFVLSIVLNGQVTQLSCPLGRFLSLVVVLVFKPLKLLPYLILYERQRVFEQTEAWSEDSSPYEPTRPSNNVHDTRATEVLVSVLRKPAATPNPGGDDGEN